MQLLMPLGADNCSRSLQCNEAPDFRFHTSRYFAVLWMWCGYHGNPEATELNLVVNDWAAMMGVTA